MTVHIIFLSELNGIIRNILSLGLYSDKLYPQLSIISIRAQSVLFPFLIILLVYGDFEGYANELNPMDSDNNSKLNLLMNYFLEMRASFENI